MKTYNFNIYIGKLNFQLDGIQKPIKFVLTKEIITNFENKKNFKNDREQIKKDIDVRFHYVNFTCFEKEEKN